MHEIIHKASTIHQLRSVLKTHQASPRSQQNTLRNASVKGIQPTQKTKIGKNMPPIYVLKMGGISFPINCQFQPMRSLFFRASLAYTLAYPRPQCADAGGARFGTWPNLGRLVLTNKENRGLILRNISQIPSF